MRRRWLKQGMALCMLLSIYLLSREGAILTAKMGTETKGIIDVYKRQVYGFSQ